MARLTPETALARYLGMGSDRSLSKVAASVPASDRVSLKTLKDWSSRFGWGKLARENDRKVTKATCEGLAATQAKEAITAGIAMERFSVAAFTKAAELLVKAEDIADVAVIVEKALDTQKQLAVMTGGVSDRTEQVGAPTKVKTPAERDQELEAEFGLLTSVPASPPAKPH